MLIWSSTFETKIELIDTQHKTLFGMVNDLTNVESAKRTEQDLDRILEALLAYSYQHFADEEVLMQHHKLDEKFISLQRMEHKSFIYDVKQMRNHVSETENLSEHFDKLARFATSWLVYHTLRIDLMIPKQIMLIKKGIAPSEAYARVKKAGYSPEIAALLLDALLHLWDTAMERVHTLEEKLANEKLPESDSL
jgi:hemerythrin-like metal-binding protein